MKQAIATLRKSLTRWADKEGELITAVPQAYLFLGMMNCRKQPLAYMSQAFAWWCRAQSM